MFGNKPRLSEQEKAQFYNKIPLRKRLEMIESLNYLLFQNKNHLQQADGKIVKVTPTDIDTLRAVIIDFMNKDTGLCIPKQQTIADKIHKVRETVNRSIQKWINLGILGVVHRYRWQKTRNQYAECEAPKQVANLYFIKGSLLKRIAEAIKNKVNYLKHPFCNKVKTLFHNKSQIIKRFYDGTSEVINKTARQLIMDRQAVIQRQQTSYQNRLNNAPFGKSKEIFLERRKSIEQYYTEKINNPEKSKDNNSLDTSLALLYETLFNKKA